MDRFLIRETLRQASRESTAIPFSDLVARLRAAGTPVTETILMRDLGIPGSGVRVVDPWDGPQSSLRPLLGAPREGVDPWIFLEDDDDPPDPDSPAPAMLRRSLVLLGETLDRRSPRDVARWVAMVEEARRLPRAA